MAYDFDADDPNDPNVDYDPRVSAEEFDSGDDEQPETDTGADEVVAALVAPAESGAFDLMTDAVRRIDLANCYRELLNMPLFENPDENSALVEQEVRVFVHDRIQVLLGIKAGGSPIAPMVKSPFGEDEVHALKVLAASFSDVDLRIIKEIIASARARGMGAQKKDGAAPAPTVKRRPAPPTPKAKPAPVAPAPQPRAQRPAAPPQPRAPAPPPAAVRPQARRPAPAQAAAAPGGPAVKRRVPGAPPPKMEQKKIVAHPETGEGIEVTQRRIQRPAGAIPFPTDPRQFEAVAAVTATAQGRAFEQNPDIQQRSNNA